MQLEAPPAAFFSAAWAPGNAEVLLSDTRADRVLRYRPDGSRAGEVSFASVGGVRYPAILGDGASVWVVSDFSRLVELDGPGLVPKVVADLKDLTFKDGTKVLGVFVARPWHKDIVTNGVFKLGKGKDTALLARLSLPPNPTWDPFFLAPQMGSARSMLFEYRSLFAAVNDTLYALEYSEPPRVHALQPRPTPLRAFPAGYDKLPPYPDHPVGVEGSLQAAEYVRATATPVGLFADSRFLYLATREPASATATTWRLHRIDPVADTLAGSLTLPTAAAELIILPGQRYWAFIEKGPYKGMYEHDTLGMVLIPTATMEAPWPAGFAVTPAPAALAPTR